MPKLRDHHANALEYLGKTLREVVSKVPNDIELGVEIFNALGTSLKAAIVGDQTTEQVMAEKIKALRGFSRKLARKVEQL